MFRSNDTCPLSSPGVFSPGPCRGHQSSRHLLCTPDHVGLFFALFFPSRNPFWGQIVRRIFSTGLSLVCVALPSQVDEWTLLLGDSSSLSRSPGPNEIYLRAIWMTTGAIDWVGWGKTASERKFEIAKVIVLQKVQPTLSSQKGLILQIKPSWAHKSTLLKALKRLQFA